ncbi:hypothetical protein ASPSYDRAFT_57369 [Aspergillus sydowii CBS 593.65]|uniref:Allergen Asp f 4 n=1 Tax=Aspergillus sydowii CBS 593.65 TaxID=1036612 RepID=A0A1L9TK94_9EURO|nr:uncharacterized protein ASPSYDRAFT_57369 [Aspergillus sydowii CBS 593.65]OJJ59854.1 hypothetical protein ASPSYDRAFT_57369 [Aspergillus sydowii CBS 593.65]
MQLKNYMLLLTAMTAGSAVARMHGHDRRHAAHRAREEKRAVGDIVTAMIDGKMVTWANEYDGDSDAAAATAATTTTSAADDAATTTETTDDIPEVSSVSSAPGTCGNWYDKSDEYSRSGFGLSTLSNGLQYVKYIGNIGNPWGSNIIEIEADKACKYQNVARFEGSETDPWTIVFWNNYGPTRKMDGWYGHSALKLTLEPGDIKYVAFDDDSQGGWSAAKGESIPVDANGGYSATWGEFDFDSDKNNGWSGFDVSCIQAQNANQEVQGMKICEHGGDQCSYVTHLAKKVKDAYTAAETGLDGIGGQVQNQPVRLVVNIDYDDTFSE